jgi:hypothetical protein
MQADKKGSMVWRSSWVVEYMLSMNEVMGSISSTQTKQNRNHFGRTQSKVQKKGWISLTVSIAITTLNDDIATSDYRLPNLGCKMPIE